MRFLFIHMVSIVPLMALAQPGYMPRIVNPCGMPPDDTLDVTGDGVPDLMIGGWSVGTDDEPSSTGSCTRYVRTLPGTTLLSGLDRSGQRVPHAFAAGDTLPALDGKIQNDLQIPRFVFTDGTIPVVQWGYGNAWKAPVMTPGLEKQVFVFKTIAPHEHRLGTFTLGPMPDLRSVRITVGTLGHADEALIVQ